MKSRRIEEKNRESRIYLKLNNNNKNNINNNDKNDDNNNNNDNNNDNKYYYMAQVTSGKFARCDWLLTWQDFSIMPAGIMQIVNAL